jgi:hypothetical protein
MLLHFAPPLLGVIAGASSICSWSLQLFSAVAGQAPACVVVGAVLAVAGLGALAAAVPVFTSLFSY